MVNTLPNEVIEYYTELYKEVVKQYFREICLGSSINLEALSLTLT